VGGPCCARILTTWFASKERGTYWGMWNIAHNLGGFAAPLVAGGFAKAMGWQWGMWAPGLIGLVVRRLARRLLRLAAAAPGCRQGRAGCCARLLAPAA
jgi:sugar phosphate permease